MTAPASRIEALAPAEQVPAHRPIAFAVRTTAPAGSVVVRVSGAPDVTGSGLLNISGGRGIDLETTSAGDPEVHVAQTPRAFLVARRPGPYYWQAYLVGAAADGADEPIGDVQTVTVEGPRPSSSRLYPRFGPRGRASVLPLQRALPRHRRRLSLPLDRARRRRPLAPAQPQLDLPRGRAPGRLRRRRLREAARPPCSGWRPTTRSAAAWSSRTCASTPPRRGTRARAIPTSTRWTCSPSSSTSSGTWRASAGTRRTARTRR